MKQRIAFVLFWGLLTTYLFAQNGNNLENTKLIEAVQNGDLKGAQAALKAGAAPNGTADYPFPPLWIAAMQGQIAIAKLLLQAGADVNGKSPGGETPLMMACNIGAGTEMVKLILSYKPDIKARSKDGITALHMASCALYPSITIMNLLLQAGIDVNELDNLGNTALINLSYNGMNLSAPHIESLIQKGAKVDHQNNNGATALMIASQNGYEAAVKVLLKAKANPLLLDNNGNTALHYCAQNGTTAPIVKLLIQAGLDPGKKNKAGKTLADLAAENYNHDVLNVLKP